MNKKRPRWQRRGGIPPRRHRKVDQRLNRWMMRWAAAAYLRIKRGEYRGLLELLVCNSAGLLTEEDYEFHKAQFREWNAAQLRKMREEVSRDA